MPHGERCTSFARSLATPISVRLHSPLLLADCPPSLLALFITHTLELPLGLLPRALSLPPSVASLWVPVASLVLLPSQYTSLVLPVGGKAPVIASSPSHLSLPFCLFPQSLSSIPTSLLASCSWCLTCEYHPAHLRTLFLASMYGPRVTGLQLMGRRPLFVYITLCSCQGSPLFFSMKVQGTGLLFRCHY